ncbi:MAG: restriction endonuclease subunit S [Ignavibacteriaceae bacterium]
MLSSALTNIDKSKWIEHRFDEIAFSISERVEPTNTDLEIYVGLEHLDSESIHIRRFGKRSDVKGTKLKVYPGDIIFGRRRAYQRKAAIANFEGFCSAHALVLRANPKVIEPKLFPFFLHSDAFMNRAVDISVGSLSPTINWGTLKKEKFLLPPKDQQAKIAELLWAADRMIEKYITSLKQLELLLLSYRKSVFTGNNINTVSLNSIAQIIMGQSPPGISYNALNDGIPFLQGNAEFGDRYPTAIKYTNEPKRIAPKDSLLISVRAPVGAINIADKNYCIGRGLAAIIPNKEIPMEYLINYLQYSKNSLDENSTGSTFKAINKDSLANIKIKVPVLSKINSALTDFKRISQSNILLKDSLAKSNKLLKSIINEIF